TPDLNAAADVVSLLRSVVETAARHIGELGGVDQRRLANQTIGYDLAHAVAGVEIAASALEYGAKGDVEARIACAFVADTVHDLVTRTLGREALWGVDDDAFAAARDFVRAYRDPSFLAALAREPGPRHLDSDFELVRDTFRRFAEEKVRPIAEHVHRENADIPEDVISGLAEIGTFGLSVPTEYDGFSEGGASEYMAMVVATEELSRGSLGAAGSLITRPEILTRALVQGGTEEQKQEWLPKIASGEIMSA